MNIKYDKQTGLVPAIVQDNISGEVLMLGYMNQQALDKTKTSGLVTFYSRSKERLWTKGETSGNFLKLIDIACDCDSDALLVRAQPSGPVCHTGERNCFGITSNSGFVAKLEQLIQGYKNNPQPQSYTSELFAKGIDRISQKVGEEAVEVVIAAKNDVKERVISEASDLIYHLLVLLSEKDCTWNDIENELASRSK